MLISSTLSAALTNRGGALLLAMLKNLLPRKG
jgi:hypothetical protein